MMDPVGLVVPIRLEVLAIGGGDRGNSYFLPPYANFQNLPSSGGSATTPYLSSLILNEPFTGARSLTEGLHLHWNLPSALRSGAYGADGELTLPAAPDRWLVTQVLADTTNRRTPAVTLRSWVIESTFLYSDGTYSPTAIPAEQPAAYQFLGRVYDYEDWLQNGGKGKYLNHLTAMGFGVPDFSSYYPNCGNVFAMIDQSLNDTYDPALRALAYSVTGWFSNPTDDPLHGQSIDGKSNQLGWLFTEGAAPPSYSLYHGVVYDVAWNPLNAYFKGGGDELTPVAGLGNTVMEAFSALAAYQLRDTGLQNVERLLNALQLGVLRELDRPDGLARLEDAIYNSEYAAGDGGLLWDIRVQPSSTINTSFGAPAQPARSLAAENLDQSIGAALADLNRAQISLDSLRARATSLQRQIFADWQKFIAVLYSTDPTQYPSPSDIYQFITAEIAALNVLTGSQIQQAQKKVDDLQTQIKTKLPAGLALSTTAAPRYYRPADPVIVLQGDGITPPSPDNAQTIQCLLTPQLVTSISLPASLVSGSAAFTLDASSLPSLPSAAQLPYPAAAALVQTDMLINPQPWGVVAGAVASGGGTANPAVLDFDATNTAIVNAQSYLLHGGAPPAPLISFSGAPPAAAIGLRAWDTPWNPIALSWQFDFQPLLDVTSSTYPPSFVLDNFAFDRGSLNFELQTTSFSTPVQQTTGHIVLSPDATIGLANEIRAYLEYVNDPELAQTLSDLVATPLLAQSFAGACDAAVMLHQTMQLPVADPLATTRIYETFSNSTVPVAVGKQNQLAPLPAFAYNPLRAGGMTLQTLWLVDEFGRFRPVDFSQLAVSETIPTKGWNPVQLLPPLRFSQGAQLTFRWLAASDPATESSSLPETNPICGLVIPNHLDSSLMFYDAAGNGIGSLSVGYGKQPFVWQDAPGSGSESGTMADAFANANPVLTGFAMSIVTNGPDYLTALIRTVDKTKVFIDPSSYQEDRSTAVLLGAPLGVVQATLSLDLAGLPAPDQSFTALQNDISGGDPLTRSVHGFPNVVFPVILGSLERLNDGLVGYFVGDASVPQFGTFYAEAADGSNPHIVVPDTGTITLSASSLAQPVTVTMLIDPRCEVHAFTGVAPVKTVDIPSDLVAAATANLTFTFLTSPLLCTGPDLAVPVPAESNGQWTWVMWGTDGWVESPIQPVNLNSALQTPSAVQEGWLKLTPKPGGAE